MTFILQRSFFFIRHAETDWNAQNLCQGQQDTPLNEKGRFEAQQLALRSCNLMINCIVSSPLQRALETAKELCQVHKDAKMHIVEDLCERSWGELEGISSKEMYAIEELEEKDFFYSPRHGVEPRNKFRQRVLKGICKAQSFHSNLFIVSHGRVFIELCYHLRIPLIRQIPNCHIFEIFPINNSWKIRNILK